MAGVDWPATALHQWTWIALPESFVRVTLVVLGLDLIVWSSRIGGLRAGFTN